jgi:hypothetical protein
MIVVKNGQKVEMSYDEVCKDLGYDPGIKFVKVTTQGRISFTAGKPSEIIRLNKDVTDKGYAPSDNLTKAVRKI